MMLMNRVLKTNKINNYQINNYQANNYNIYKKLCAYFSNNLKKYNIEDYVIKETNVKFNKKLKYFYEDEDHYLYNLNNKYFNNKNNIMDLNTSIICKTCNGLGIIIDNISKKYELCPDCN